MPGASITCHGVPVISPVPTVKLFADGADVELTTGVGAFVYATNRKLTGSFDNETLTGLHYIELRNSVGNLVGYGFAVLATSGAIDVCDTREGALAATEANATTNRGTITTAVDTRASQASVDDLPTNAELTAALDAADDAVLAAIAAALVKVRKYTQLITRKDAAIATDNAAELTEINANGGSGAGAFSNQTDSEEAIRDRGDAAWVTGGGGGGAGSGAYTITITVNDGATALQNATVRLTEGINTFTATTSASGVATFALDAATYDVAITKDGYSFTPTTLVVSATAGQTYSMTAFTITPSDPAQTTGYVTVYTGAHVVVSGAVVEIQILKLANGTTGSGINDPLLSGTTNVSGYVEFTGLPRGATYQVRVAAGPWFRGVTASAATTPLAGVLGLPE